MFALLPALVVAAQAVRVADHHGFAVDGDVVGAVVDDHGRTIGLAGMFQLGCDAEDQESVKSSVVDFVNGHADQFLLEEYLGDSTLRLRETTWDGDVAFIEFDQVHEDLPVLGGEVVVVIDGACNLLTFNGAFNNSSALPPSPLVVGKGMKEVDPKDVCEGSTNEPWPVSSELNTVRAVWIPDHGKGFEYVTNNYVCVVDASGAVISVASNWRNDYVASNISITRGNYTSTNLETRAPGVTNTIAAGRNDFFGTCTWELSYFFAPAPLDRVQYEPGSEVDEVGPCATYTPVFHANTRWNAEFRQQEAFWSLRTARAYYQSYMWNVFSATQKINDGVRANVDMGPPYCSPACYNPVLTDIFLRERDDDGIMYDHRIDRYAHEYGHHVVETYGGLGSGNTCPTDQADGVNESIADALAMVVMINKFNAAYSATWTRVGVGGSRHLPNGTTCTTNANCPSTHRCVSGVCVNSPLTYTCNTGVEVHGRGEAFEHAIWEIMHNHDCSSHGNDCNLSFGNAINPCWTDMEASQYVARAIAYALKSTGPTVTYTQIVNAIVYDLSVSQGVTCGVVPHQSADYVFAHHGL